MPTYGRYELLREIGQGSMGVVHLAHDPQIDRRVALKVIRQEHARNAYFLARFYKEAKAIGRVSHPNIVTVYDIGEDHGDYFIAMEYIDGLPLNQVIQRGGLDFEAVVTMGIKLAKALDFAHQKGIIHRDIKPANIIIAENGEPIITDFGIAHVDDPDAAQQTQIGEVLGTPRYMSPEQILGHGVDGRTDLYALGVILYELATGRRLIQNKNMSAIVHAVVNMSPEEIDISTSQVPENYKRQFQKVLLRALQKDPQDRYPNGTELAAALSACLEPTTRSFSHDSTQIAPSRSRKRPTGRLLLAAVLLLALLGLWVFGGGNLVTGMERLTQGIFSKTPTTRFATFRIESNPQGAQVYIEGKLQGTAPLQLKLPLGKYRVELRLPGHFNWERTLELVRQNPDPIVADLDPLLF